MKGLSKLLARYIFASEALFMILLMPIMFYVIMGQAMVFGLGRLVGDKSVIARSLIAGIGGTTIISSAFTIIPITIVDFKNSVLMKRMGATNVKPIQFILVIVLLFFLQASFTFFYSRFIATLVFGPQLGWSIAFQYNIGIGYLYSLIIMFLSIAIGLFIAAISPTVRRATMFSRLIYMPMSILSGGLIPVSIIYSSTFLRTLSWFNPLKYAIEPYLQQQGGFVGSTYHLQEWQYIAYPFIVITIASLCIWFVSKKLKWTS